ncbi:MAG: class I SAM-dependent methyltransferase [Actinomycetota bacterium]
MGSNDEARAWEEVSEAWERYAPFIEQASSAIQEWLLQALKPKAGQVFLDLAAGTGPTTIALAEAVGPGGKVICTDYSVPMVDAARRAVEKRGLRNVEFRQADAQDIRLPDSSVDGAVCRFAIMLVPDQGTAAREVHRVLRPGGRFAFSTWAGPDRNPWIAALGMALAQHGKPAGPNPFEAGGVFSLIEEPSIQDLLVSAGFIDIEVQRVGGKPSYESFEQYWEVQSAVAGPAAVLLKSLPANEVAEIKDSAEEFTAPFESPDGGLQFPAEAMCAAARRPAS